MTTMSVVNTAAPLLDEMSEAGVRGSRRAVGGEEAADNDEEDGLKGAMEVIATEDREEGEENELKV